MTFDSIAFSKGFILIPNYQKPEQVDTTVLYSLAQKNPVAMLIQAEVMRFGKMLSTEAFQAIMSLDSDKQKRLAIEISNYLKTLFGDGEYKTLFGNYPETVLGLSEFEMLVHTILQYVTNGAYHPVDYVDPSAPDTEIGRSIGTECIKDKYDLIEVGDQKMLLDKIKVLLEAEASLTPYDVEVVKYFCNNYETIGLTSEDLRNGLPSDIPFKETMCVVACTKYGAIMALKTTTDVLRVACHMSNIDVSLAPIPKMKDLGWRKEALSKEDKKPYNFKHFSRPERRLLMTLIENSAIGREQMALEDMKKHANRWIRLGEILHPAQEAKKYPKTAKLFDILRNDKKSIKTWASKVEEAKKEHDLTKILSLYAQRPGEMARSLDYLVRTYNSMDEFDLIVKTLSGVVSKMAMKTFYELVEHFFKRTKPVTGRSIFIKGARRPTVLPDLPAIPEKKVDAILTIFIKEMVYRFGTEKTALTGQYILDADLADIALPQNMRSMNDAISQVARGTKCPLPEKAKIIRNYVHWIDPDGTDDLDLHASLYSEDFKKKATISWNSCYKLGRGNSYVANNPKSSDTVAIFSGDVIGRKGNDAEYIDVHIENAIKEGFRYVITTVSDYRGHCFRNAYAGLMARDAFGKPGDVTWAPSTVENGIKITSKCQAIIMMIVDLVDRKYIMVDEDLSGIPVANIHNDQLAMAIDRYCGTNNKFLNAKKIIEMNLTARGAEVGEMAHDDFVKNLEVIEKDKESLAQRLETIKNQLASYLDEHPLLNGDYDDIAKGYEDEINEIENTLAKQASIHFISADDLMKDYASILSWMF